MIERTIKQDNEGLFLVTNGCIFRPGPLYYTMRRGLKTDTANLKRGDKVATRIMSNPVIEIMLTNGDKRYWEDAAHKADQKKRGNAPTWTS